MFGANLNTRARVNPTKKKRPRSEKELWGCMQQRCYNPKHDSYYLYGQRGITICAGYKVFNYFLADLGPRPSMEYSIDRIENDLGYWCGRCTECQTNQWPRNVRWADRATQHANRRVTRFITVNGVTQTVQRWVEQTGISYDTLFYRHSTGWPEDQILSPPDRRRPKFNAIRKHS